MLLDDRFRMCHARQYQGEVPGCIVRLLFPLQGRTHDFEKGGVGANILPGAEQVKFRGSSRYTYIEEGKLVFLALST